VKQKDGNTFADNECHVMEVIPMTANNKVPSMYWPLRLTNIVRQACADFCHQMLTKTYRAKGERQQMSWFKR